MLLRDPVSFSQKPLTRPAFSADQPCECCTA